jgi:fumarate reductase subunit C
VNAEPGRQVEAWLWLAQRASALVLALAVTVHLATLITAVRGGLDAAEIVSRLRGHPGWLAFYAVFALAAAVHAPLGMRAILREWARLGPAATTVVCAVLSVALLLLGLRAAIAMYLGPA